MRTIFQEKRSGPAGKDKKPDLRERLLDGKSDPNVEFILRLASLDFNQIKDVLMENVAGKSLTMKISQEIRDILMGDQTGSGTTKNIEQVARRFSTSVGGSDNLLNYLSDHRDTMNWYPFCELICTALASNSKVVKRSAERIALDTLSNPTLEKEKFQGMLISLTENLDIPVVNSTKWLVKCRQEERRDVIIRENEAKREFIVKLISNVETKENVMAAAEQFLTTENPRELLAAIGIIGMLPVNEVNERWTNVFAALKREFIDFKYGRSRNDWYHRGPTGIRALYLYPQEKQLEVIEYTLSWWRWRTTSETKIGAVELLFKLPEEHRKPELVKRAFNIINSILKTEKEWFVHEELILKFPKNYSKTLLKEKTNYIREKEVTRHMLERGVDEKRQRQLNAAAAAAAAERARNAIHIQVDAPRNVDIIVERK
ncbi:MAG: hypothetical protein V1492_04895 [Candidatus Micrarchaeota archaeon]